MSNKVYAFEYCDCIYESAYATMSLHYTREGAEKAMKAHKKAKRKEFKEMDEGCIIPNKELGITFGKYERWCVQELEILP